MKLKAEGAGGIVIASVDGGREAKCEVRVQVRPQKVRPKRATKGRNGRDAGRKPSRRTN